MVESRSDIQNFSTFYGEFRNNETFLVKKKDIQKEESYVVIGVSVAVKKK